LVTCTNTSGTYYSALYFFSSIDSISDKTVATGRYAIVEPQLRAKLNHVDIDLDVDDISDSKRDSQHDSDRDCEATAHASRRNDQHIDEDEQNEYDSQASDGDWVPLPDSESVDSLEHDHDIDTANEKCGSWPKSWIIDGMSDLLVHLYCQQLNLAARAYNVRVFCVVGFC
jgi:hypothetical protein